MTNTGQISFNCPRWNSLVGALAEIGVYSAPIIGQDRAFAVDSERVNESKET